MKKVAIITLNGYFNYGNRLQNYALQEVLKSLGYDVETVLVKFTDQKQNNKNIITPFFNALLSKIFKKSVKIIKSRKTGKYRKIRIARFMSFTQDYITETEFSIDENNIPSELPKQFDYFIVGSDQVWNPYYIKGSSIYFLTFVPKGKRLSFAASFGISEIPKEFEEKYRLWLSEMAGLSVREEAGSEIIKKLTGKEASIVIDPTLMLTKDKWLSISKPYIKKPKKKFLLTYFLGDVSEDNKRKIKNIAIENKLEIVNLSSLVDKKYYIADPAEFIDFIYTSDLFLTDSFHGAVFSILLEKPFFVFNRVGKGPSMNSRINTLLSTFKLNNQKWDQIDNIDMFNSDYSHVVDILNFERNKALEYLKSKLSY